MPTPNPGMMAGKRPPAESVRPVDYVAATREHARHLGSSVNPVPTDDDAPSPTKPTGPADVAARLAARQAARDKAAQGKAVRGTAERATAAPGDKERGKTAPNKSAPDRTDADTPADRAEAAVARQRADLARRITDALRANANRSLNSGDSLYSAVTGQDSGIGDRLQLSPPEGDVHTVGAWDATLADLQRVIETPEDSWTADLGRTDYFLREQLCVQITRADAQIVGIYRAGWALARRPEIPLPEAPGPGRSASGGTGTRYPTNQRELVSRLRQAGFVVVTSGSTHGKITHPDHPGRFLPYSSTPSGQRYGRHVVTAVKRVFGIDLRRGPAPKV